jgi:methionyl-tRNA formyltransferase
MTNPRIVFYGTPDFAVPSLNLLIQHGYHVAAVVTAPDKPAGRGLKPSISAVKRAALEHGITVLQPENMKDTNFFSELKLIAPDLQIVIAFRMLPVNVWSIAPMGTFNLHASLLPQYRGAAPIHHAVMNGEKITGVTTFFLDERIDTGRIIASRQTDIGEDESTGSLHDRLMTLGAGLVIDTVQMICSGTANLTDQHTLISNPDQLKKAPKIFRENCRIKWENATTGLHNFIRGLSPFPGAFTTYTTLAGDEVDLRILKAAQVVIDKNATPGAFFRQKQQRIIVATGDGWLSIHELQLQGRKKMGAEAFLRGYASFFPELQ